MKNYFFIAALATVAVFTSCDGGSGSGGSNSSAKIKMTTEQGGYFYFSLAGSGTATVDWGDGSEKATLTLNENRYGVEFSHTYPNATIRTISINGDNITGLSCLGITSLDVSKNTALTSLSIYSQLTSLDVSKCTALRYLSVSGPLTSLDVSKNTALTSLTIYDNYQLTSLDVSKNTALTYLGVSGKLTAAALNALFGTLHSNPGEKRIDIIGNPGAADCDRSIAERKGWTFANYYW